MTNGTRRGWGVSVMPRPLFTLVKDPVPIVQEGGWAPGTVWTVAKNLVPPGFETRTVQPVASRYADWVTRPTCLCMIHFIYRVSQEECARLREGVPYVKVYRYNPKHLCPKLNGYGDNGQGKVWSSGGSTHCTCKLTSLIGVYPWVWCPITESHLTLAYSWIIPECAVSHVTSVLAFICHV